MTDQVDETKDGNHSNQQMATFVFRCYRRWCLRRPHVNVLYPNATPGAFGKWNVPFLKFLALFSEPSLRNEFLRLGEQGRIIMNCSIGDGYYRLESDLISSWKILHHAPMRWCRDVKERLTPPGMNRSPTSQPEDGTTLGRIPGATVDSLKLSRKTAVWLTWERISQRIWKVAGSRAK